MPRIRVGQVPADHRPDHRRNNDRDRGQGKRLLPLLRREMIQNNRLLSRLQPAAKEPLQCPEQQDFFEIRRDPAGERSRRERSDANQKIILPPQPPAKRARNRQHDPVRHQIRRQRPGALVAADRQAAGDVRQRNVHDRGVQHFHERAQRDDDRHQPRIGARLPALSVAHRPRPFIEPSRSVPPKSPAAVRDPAPAHCR